MKFHVNILALIGAFIGIISIICPWVYYYSMPGPPDTGDDLLQLLSNHSGFSLPASLFILSTLLALISPLSFIGQLYSITLFPPVLERINSDTFEDGASYAYFGIALGIISIIILVISILLPLRKKSTENKTCILDRILTFNPQIVRSFYFFSMKHDLGYIIQRIR